MFSTRIGKEIKLFPCQIWSISGIHSIHDHTHGKFYTGKYILGHDDPQIKNTMQPQTLDCIYLRPSTMIYGKHKLFHLTTKRIITRKHCSPAMITPNIINLINTIATTETVNSILTNDTSFTGVDNNSNEFENELDDNIDSNTINEILHEPSEFHTLNQNNNISSSNEVFDNTKVTIHEPETYDKTEKENIFEYKNDDLLDNSFIA